MPVYGNASPPGAATVTTSATALGGPLGNRTNITLWNADSANTVYVGTTSGVTATTGVPIPPNQYLSLDFGPQITIFGIVSSGTASVRWLEAY